jgi:hypothetical protein
MRVNLVAQRPLGNSGVNLGAGYAWAKAISYYRDQVPACQTAPGVFAAKSIGRNECSAGNPFITLSYLSGPG